MGAIVNTWHSVFRKLIKDTNQIRYSFDEVNGALNYGVYKIYHDLLSNGVRLPEFVKRTNLTFTSATSLSLPNDYFETLKVERVSGNITYPVGFCYDNEHINDFTYLIFNRNENRVYLNVELNLSLPITFILVYYAKPVEYTTWGDDPPAEFDRRYRQEIFNIALDYLYNLEARNV